MLTRPPPSRFAAVARRLRPVAPLLIVNAFAVLGQVFYGYDHYAPADWTPTARLAVAIGAAVGLESIALYVSWHAHDALLMGASATAARMRRAAYLIAFGVAAINYAHFSPDWRPTGAAVVFAGFSASSPWLWGLHTRRAHHIQLIREGQVDSTGAVFSAERWRAFPARTFKARRWSIDYGVTDPLLAWRAYNASRQTFPDRSGTDESGVRDESDPGLTPSTDPADEALVDMLREWAVLDGEMPSREKVRRQYSIGSKRAERVRALALTPADQSVDEDDRAKVAA